MRTHCTHSSTARRPVVAATSTLVACALVAGCDGIDRPTAPTITTAAPAADLVAGSGPEYVGYVMADISDGTESVAVGINRSGVVVGWYAPAGGGTQFGFVRDPQAGTLAGIPPLLGYASNVATGVNDSGVVVGTSRTSQGRPAGWVRRPGASVTPLDPGSCGYSAANAVNNAGVVVGMCGGKPALWTAYGTSLPVIAQSLDASNPAGEIRDIDDAGDMVGWSNGTTYPYHVATRWGSPSDAHRIPIPGATGESQALSINRGGLVVGTFDSSSVQRGFRRDPAAGTTTVLANPAWAISNKARVVGVHAGGPVTAWTLAPGGSMPTTLPFAGGQTLAYDVDACGTIVGMYSDGVRMRAVQWKKAACDP
jgi:uncharacterized membrane protein